MYPPPAPRFSTPRRLSALIMPFKRAFGEGDRLGISRVRGGYGKRLRKAIFMVAHLTGEV